MHRLDFPVEIWCLVAGSLGVADLLQLRSVHTTVRHIVDSNELWGPRVRQRWFSADDADLSRFHAIGNMLQFYREHHTQDIAVVRTLRQRPFALKDGWALTEMPESTMPVLVQLKNDKSDLTTRYYASSVLEVIRHRKAVVLLDAYLSAPHDKPQPLFEDVCTDVCLFDREYDRLLPYRSSILKSTIREVKNHPDFDEGNTASSTIFLIINALAMEIHKRVESGYTEDSLENLSLLRFYAGETEGTQLMQYAVIQKLASHFNIETSISSTFLIVKDDSFKTGFSYISLKKDLFRPKLFSISDIYLFVRRTSSSDPMSTLHELTFPLTIQQYIYSLLEFRRSHSLAHGWDLLQGSYMYSEAYPCSLNHIPSSMADYYALCIGALGKTSIDLSEFSYLAKRFPFCASFIDEILKPKAAGFKLDAMSSFRELGSKQPIDRLLIDCAPPLLIGQVVLHVAGYHSIISGYSFTPEETFYSLINGIETRHSRVRLLQKEEITPELVDLLTNEYKVGVYFTHFNEEKGMFEMTQELRKVYPNN